MSWDTFLGGPFNIASYALFTKMVAHVCDLEAAELIINSGDTHIYLDHIDQVKEQLSRAPLPLPSVRLSYRVSDITKFTMEDIKLVGYNSHEKIAAQMAV